MKNYVKPVIEKDNKFKKKKINRKSRLYAEFLSYYEIAARFMYDYYGIDRKSELVNGLLFDNKTKIYLQMKLEVMQEEMHLFPY